MGTVENPLSLLDAFALVAPGQVPHPDEVTVLFDGHAPSPAGLHLPNLSVLEHLSSGGQFGPGLIVVGAARPRARRSSAWSASPASP